jgi:hypothetical protein
MWQIVKSPEKGYVHDLGFHAEEKNTLIVSDSLLPDSGLIMHPPYVILDLEELETPAPDVHQQPTCHTDSHTCHGIRNKD